MKSKVLELYYGLGGRSLFTMKKPAVPKRAPVFWFSPECVEQDRQPHRKGVKEDELRHRA